jgi:DMSO reductase family type II enzyme chaperone
MRPPSRASQFAAPSAAPARRILERKELMAEAELLRLIALAFSYPSPQVVSAVRRGLHEIAPAPARGDRDAGLAPALRALGRAWRAATAEDLAAEYSRLFLGAGRVPLREGGYGDGLRFAGQPYDIADLNGFYLAFGFAISAEEPSPPDHLGTELEFASLLLLKKALALERGRAREVRIVDDALSRFLEDHLGRWAASVARALLAEGAAPPYARLAAMMEELVAGQCRRLGARPRSARSGTAEDPMGGESLVCPFAGTEAAAEGPRGMP